MGDESKLRRRVDEARHVDPPNAASIRHVLTLQEQTSLRVSISGLHGRLACMLDKPANLSAGSKRQKCITSLIRLARTQDKEMMAMTR